MLLILVLRKLGQPGPHGNALSQKQKENQAIAETYVKKISIEELKVGIINIVNYL